MKNHVNRRVVLFIKYASLVLLGLGTWWGFIIMVMHFFGEIASLYMLVLVLILALLWNIWRYTESKVKLEE